MRDEWGSRETLWRNPNMEHVISISCVCDASRRIDNASFRSIMRCQVVYKVVEQPPSANRWQLQFAQKAKWCERVFVLSACVFFYPIYVFTFSQPFWQSEWIRNGGKNYATRGRAEQTSVEWAGWRGERGGRRMVWNGNEIKRNMLATRQHGINQFNLLSQRVKGMGEGRREVER